LDPYLYVGSQVSDLLAEERRRCQEVFGSDLAQSVLSELIVETFSPLISSYHHRLTSGPMPFSDVVGLFSETLRFLSRECDLISLNLQSPHLLRIVTTACEPYLDFVKR